MARLSSIARVSCLLLGLTTVPAIAHAIESEQAAQLPNIPPVTTQGVVVAASRTTLLIRTGDRYQLFELDNTTTRPDMIPERATVSVVYTPGMVDAPVAHTVRITALPPPIVTAQPPQPGAQPPPTPTAEPLPAEPVPQSIKNMEASIQRQTRRWKIGLRGGMALDPELFVFGVQSELGPFFNSNLYARPNFELGFGEVTTLVAANFEVAYRVPRPVWRNYSVFLGAGPALNFTRESFETPAGTEERDRFDFSDLGLDVGFNFLIGVQYTSGFFMEFKSSIYALPYARFQVGFNF